MYDLKKVEEKFHEYLKTGLDEEKFRIHEIEITEGLLKKQDAFYIPFGFVSYFLVIEDEKPVVYANVSSRMDLNLIVFVDEDGYEEYDVWMGGHKDVTERYSCHLRNVKPFDYKKLRFISDVKR